MHKVRRASLDDVMRAVGLPTLNEIQARAAQAEAEAKEKLLQDQLRAESERRQKEARKAWHDARWHVMKRKKRKA